MAAQTASNDVGTTGWPEDLEDELQPVEMTEYDLERLHAEWEQDFRLAPGIALIDPPKPTVNDDDDEFDWPKPITR